MQSTKPQEKIRTGGLCHVAIDVTNIGRSAQFYLDLFNMEIVSRSDEIVHLKTPGGRDSFFLFKADGPVNLREAGLAHFHFGFRIEEREFDRAMDLIRRRNIKIHHNPRRSDGRFVYIEDPDGYVIQLEPGDCA